MARNYLSGWLDGWVGGWLDFLKIQPSQSPTKAGAELGNKYKEGSWKKWRVGLRKRKREDSQKDALEEKKFQGVIFVPHTMHSELASRMREKLKKWGNLN